MNSLETLSTSRRYAGPHLGVVAIAYVLLSGQRGNSWPEGNDPKGELPIRAGRRVLGALFENLF